MKKILFILISFSLLFTNCDKVEELLKDDSRNVNFVIKKYGSISDQRITMITYTGEDGETIFDDLKLPANQWYEGGNNYSIGDRISLEFNTPIDIGTIELSIDCTNCENEEPKVSKTVDLTKIRVGEISLTLQ